MVYSRSSKLHSHHSFCWNISKYFNCFDNKRSILLLILILLTILIFYLISYTPKQSGIIEDTDICSKLLYIIYNSNRTLCSKEADRRGNKQRIIALSIFGPKENQMFVDEKFSEMILPLIDEAKLLFPSWTIRLYADKFSINRLHLQNLTRQATNIDICNVDELPIIGNVADYLPGKLWRFLPALDPMVDFISSRDLDSPLTQREQVVVEQFIDSSYLFLSLRDHPFHNIPILGGLWTSALYRDRLLFLRLFSILLDKNQVQRYSLINDQKLLCDLVWPKVRDQSLVFDSYTCHMFPHGQQRPFPTQRPSRECHVGCVRPCCQNSSNIVFKDPCPEKCRPNDHLDWIYC
ncbi:unnamed protein product [Adineta steineri]|uniref:Uncharacterized protein n=1 Tax=Adineta steineri TaxID=433720 RepID=A0A814EQ51_9BILA|nr:unnamed protein product [Adineta steineri]CAF3583961.1 unnamed protein product [Adineta steineri]